MAIITVTIIQDDGDAYPVQIDTQEPVSKLKEYTEMITGIATDKQLLFVNSRPVDDSGTVAAANISDSDMLQVRALTPEQMQAFRQQLQQSRQTEWQQAQAAAEAPPIDPLDPEYQAKMYNAIQQQNVHENYETAMEHSPEVFTQVEMLYIDMAVNNEPIKAFIDSGAQMTIMTEACAEKCGIMRLIDTRFHGMAVGVGSSKILGKIHMCPVKVGSEYITSSVTVLEQKDGPQFIFGLDNLKRHHCCINLAKNVLEVGSCNISMPFLSEHAIPKDFNKTRQKDDAAAVEPSDTGAASATATPSGDTAAPPVHSQPTTTSTTPSVQARAPTPATTTPATTTPAAPATSGVDAATLAQAQQLAEITGADIAACLAALRSANGNIDMAAAALMMF